MVRYVRRLKCALTKQLLSTRRYIYVAVYDNTHDMIAVILFVITATYSQQITRALSSPDMDSVSKLILPCTFT